MRSRTSPLSGKLQTRTFQTNVFGYFFMTKAALEYLKEGATIVNTTSMAKDMYSELLIAATVD